MCALCADLFLCMRVRTLFDGFAPKLVDTFLCTSYTPFTRARVCVHNASLCACVCTHKRACVRSHILERIRFKLGGNILWDTGSCKGSLILRARVQVRTMRICAIYGMCVCIPTFSDGFAPNLLVDTLIIGLAPSFQAKRHTVSLTFLERSASECMALD
jgi:hypothetical protein